MGNLHGKNSHCPPIVMPQKQLMCLSIEWAICVQLGSRSYTKEKKIRNILEKNFKIVPLLNGVEIKTTNFSAIQAYQ